MADTPDFARPNCPFCGYALTGLLGSSCPECGRSLLGRQQNMISKRRRTVLLLVFLPTVVSLFGLSIQLLPYGRGSWLANALAVTGLYLCPLIAGITFYAKFHDGPRWRSLGAALALLLGSAVLCYVIIVVLLFAFELGPP
jgi:hypothetical protein